MRCSVMNKRENGVFKHLAPCLHQSTRNNPKKDINRTEDPTQDLKRHLSFCPDWLWFTFSEPANLRCGSKIGTQNATWQMDTWTKTCGPLVVLFDPYPDHAKRDPSSFWPSLLESGSVSPWIWLKLPTLGPKGQEFERAGWSH